MKPLRRLSFVKSALWRLGRRMYTYARGDGENDPATNGEYWFLREVLRKAGGAPILLDVGANRGDWTGVALQHLNGSKAARIHAFEPSAATRALLTNRFGTADRVVVERFALCDRVGEGVFYTDKDGAGTNSLSSVSGQNVEKVELNTLDEFLRASGIVSASMVKIDTEGFDMLVLKGGAGALAEGRIEAVQFEYNWRWLVNHACLRDVFEFIADKPYRLGKLCSDTIEFYDRWHFELDRFFENNYVLIRKDSELCRLGTPTAFDRSNIAQSL